jgi:hypothetical protein
MSLPHCDPDCPPNAHTKACDRRYHAPRPARPPATVTPIRPTEPTAREVLRASTTEALVDAVIHLTHQTHTAKAAAAEARVHGLRDLARAQGERLSDLRRQRDMVRAELVRRCTA